MQQAVGTIKGSLIMSRLLVVYKMRVLAHFDPWGIFGLEVLSLCVLNCFKYFLIYILRQNVAKNQIRKTISSGKMFQYSQIVYIKSITQ